MRRILAITLTLLAAGAIAVLGTGAGDEGSGGSYKVRAVFDNAFSLIKGEDVRVSGVNVGKIESLSVTPDNRAAVVMSINEKAFQDFRADAKCTIRPQSLIGEKYVECSLTEQRPQGQEPPPPLREIPEGEPGAGQRLLPVDQTSKPIDLDLLNNITRLPQRQRLAIILNELGAGFAGRSEDLNETVRRANPALGATNRVLAILARQNRVLRDLATNSDTVLEPLARDRARVASFIENANTVSQATAQRRQDLERNFERLPRFLRELRPTMARLGSFSDEFQPVLSDLQGAAPSVNRLFRELGPFSEAGIPAIESLGQAAEAGRPALVRAKPIIDDLGRLTREARPLADNLQKLTTSFQRSGGIERFMDYVFYQATAINGFDGIGHYLRAGLIVNTCSQYTTDPQPGCTARFTEESDAARAASVNPTNVRQAFSAGADHSAAALAPAKASRPARRSRAAVQPKPLKMPRALLPGQDAPAPKASAATRPAPAGPSAAQEGMLDYLLGSGG